MFTGLVEEIGEIVRIDSSRGARRFEIRARIVMDGLQIDDSVAINGTCLTVIKIEQNSFFVEAVQETLEKTTLTKLQTGSKVNLERAVRADSRMGGHFVQGHVDGVGKVLGWQEQQGGLKLKIEIPAVLEKYMISKGSITVNGCSLTIAHLERNIVHIALIPHTLEMTTFGQLKPGDCVNIEADMLGKYIYKYLKPFRDQLAFSGLDIKMED